MLSGSRQGHAVRLLRLATFLGGSLHQNLFLRLSEGQIPLQHFKVFLKLLIVSATAQRKVLQGWTEQVRLNRDAVGRISRWGVIARQWGAHLVFDLLHRVRRREAQRLLYHGLLSTVHADIFKLLVSLALCGVLHFKVAPRRELIRL